MSRRSQSPEGVGDLLKQDSFDDFDDELVNDAGDADLNMNGESMYEDKDGQSFSGDMGAQSEAKASEVADAAAPGKPAITRIPVPSFKGVSTESASGTRTVGGKGPARYFIVKSNNSGNIDHSIRNGIWATQKHNEDKFVDAYKTASHVYLVFSVNMSGHFQGYAKMSGLPFRHQQGTWEGTSSVSNSFNVDWVRRFDLPFRETESMTNPLNENKPIKISRDGQELPLSLALRVCRMFDEGADAAGVPRPAPPVRNPGMRAGPAVTGFGGGRGMGRGRSGDHGGGPRGPPGGGMVPTPMGMMPAQMAMQMGMSNPTGVFPGGMGGMDPMMMNMPMEAMGQMGMNPMMAARMQMMAGQQGMGMNGMPGLSRGPVPPPKPPPRTPPSNPESEIMQMMMKMRAGRMGDGRGEEEIMLRALELSRGRSPRRDRHYRSRSRSASPRRGRSRRRSRSRSRSRSRGRGRDRDMDMAYEDYLEAFKAMNRKKASDSGGSRGMQQMLLQQMQGMVGDGARSGGSSAMGGGSMARGQPGVNNMSEEEYVRVWEHYSKISGQPFDAQTVRGWYRQHKQFSAAAR